MPSSGTVDGEADSVSLSLSLIDLKMLGTNVGSKRSTRKLCDNVSVVRKIYPLMTLFACALITLKFMSCPKYSLIPTK